MGQLVPFTTDDGVAVLVEVNAPSPDGGPVMRGTRPAAIADRARHSFEDAVGHIEPAVQGLVQRMRSLAEKPDEVLVKFGINLHAEAGAFIAAAGTTANFSVALTWRRGAEPATKSTLDLEAPESLGRD
ncbi:MAG: hypothetical protein HOV87_20120 [Catenulispora sp.]|nr:hypothetical protein [Catenulispora sp.]